MYTIDEILKSEIVSIDLLRKIRSLYDMDLDRVKILYDTNSEDNKVYYTSDSGELIPIVFIENEDNQYNAYYYETNQQTTQANKSTSKIKVLTKPGMTGQMQPENLQPIANLKNNNKVTPFDSSANTYYPSGNKAAFAKIGILLTVSILAAIFLSSLILLLK